MKRIIRRDEAKHNRAGHTKLIALALTTALAGATLTGCATSAAPPAAQSASKAEAALAKGKHNSAVGHAEAAVLAEPRNAAYRTTLGSAYLEAGRFTSAATAFEDALTLGDGNPRTALSLALALGAEGKSQQAIGVLNDWQDRIAPSDLGLAFSLSGQPERGIHILTLAVRGGENTAKVRQNLAYSFALAGRWREARLMAAEDVPADQLGARMSEWANLAHPAAHRERIASLLSVPVAAGDPGQPVQLALSNHPSADQLALEAMQTQPESFASAANTTAEQASYELPPIGDPVDFTVAASTYQAPAAAPASRPTSFDSAFQSSQPVAVDTQRFASQETTKRAAPATAKTALPKSAVSQARAPIRNGTHLVQLGSFSSETAARRAWNLYAKRYPELGNREMVITRAVVSGKQYWRVSAGGFDARSSQAMCSQVKNASGANCFAYAESRPLPGAVDSGRRLANR